MLFAWGLGVFVVSLAWSLGLALDTTPIGASEDHFAVGQRLYRTGSLTGENDPGLLRPPGYPVFVAATLHVRDAFVALGFSNTQVEDEDAVLLGQCLLVAAAATVIFAFGATLLPPFEAACAGLVFACGPISIALVGLHSYYLLHILGIAVGTAQLAFAASTPRGRSLLPGILWGITTLVRPVSLIWPPFVFLLARIRREGVWRSAALFTLLFTVGMAIPILPYAVRNYSITGRLVLVNVQGGFALWATTAGQPQAPEEFVSWPLVWSQHGMALYRQVTGDSEYDLATFRTHVLELEDAFKRQALKNLRRRPSVYLHNVVNSFCRFWTDPMDSWPITFADQNRLSVSRTEFLVGAYSLGLLLLALPGLVRGLWRRDASAWTVLLVFCALAAAHAITYMNQRFTYVKLPLLAMGLVTTWAALEDRTIALGRTRVRLRLAAVLAATTLVCSASATGLWLAR